MLALEFNKDYFASDDFSASANVVTYIDMQRVNTQARSANWGNRWKEQESGLEQAGRGIRLQYLRRPKTA